jgi:hypothetical protein
MDSGCPRITTVLQWSFPLDNRLSSSSTPKFERQNEGAKSAPVDSFQRFIFRICANLVNDLRIVYDKQASKEYWLTHFSLALVWANRSFGHAGIGLTSVRPSGLTTVDLIKIRYG